MAEGLKSALGLGAREHIALVGGGGKTTLMFALARKLRMAGQRVVTTTTTKVRHREALNSEGEFVKLSDRISHEKVKKALESHGHVFVASGVLESGKVEGIKPVCADSIYQDPSVDYLIVEADGASGRPLKAPAGHEPVIPSSSTLVVAMMGLEVLGKPLESGIVFRPELFEKLTGLSRGERLSPETIVRVFQSPEGLFKGSPDSAGRVVFLNKLDLMTEDREARILADSLLKGPQSAVDLVLIGSVLKEIFYTKKL